MSSPTANMFFTDPDLRIDEAHQQMGFFSKELSHDVWYKKYRYGDEKTLSETFQRVARGVYASDSAEYREVALQAMEAGLLVPAGRILAGAGTLKRVTLQNCYVNMIIEDAMESIQESIKRCALTMQQGGGMGSDWSPVRPEGAILLRTQTEASGPIPFMRQGDAMSKTVRSAGERRGAMMYTLCDTHPDLIKFIKLKQVKGQLTEANLSILVSDAFMEAIAEDQEWLLYFAIPPKKERDPAIAEYDFEDDEGVKQYVYEVWQARDLWEVITKATYEYSEPGIIFIDRVNDINNLWYCEDIRCTNPCGEQPLAPNTACNLAHSNLARMVRNPFKENASFNFELLRYIAKILVRFLDNVVDVSLYPLPEQEAAQIAKRLEGQGFTGLADAMHQMRIRYGSPKSIELAERIAKTICEAAYDASIELAEERGTFPLFDAEKYLAPNTFAYNRLSAQTKEAIQTRGIRNARLLSIAPVGTTSVVFGDPASGIEPTFAHALKRKVRQTSGSGDTYNEYVGWGYSARLYKHIYGETSELPTYMVTMKDLTVSEHILVMSRVQYWVDASVSKTINIPEEMPYEEFAGVYSLAYNNGCKACSTYRPSAVRGSILEDASTPIRTDDVGKVQPHTSHLRSRPRTLNGSTYQIKWPRRDRAFYLTINNNPEDGTPFEAFITSKDTTDSEWTAALSLMVTAIFRKGGNVDFVADELKQIQSTHDGAWIDKKYYGSIPAYIGYLIEEHLAAHKFVVKAFEERVIDVGKTMTWTSPDFIKDREKVILHFSEGNTLKYPEGGLKIPDHDVMGICPACKAPAIVHEQGCAKCTSCGYSECN